VKKIAGALVGLSIYAGFWWLSGEPIPQERGFWLMWGVGTGVVFIVAGYTYPAFKG